MSLMWDFRGQRRPDFAIDPGPDQESVWDYPRPPLAVASARLVEARHGATVIARTNKSFRVLETASPPTFYVPPGDVARDALVETAGSSVCEWKGAARYWALASDPAAPVG